MAQVAFDTLKFVETLESAGLPKEQARAISIAVRESHEVMDVATRRDLNDVKKDLSVEIASVRQELSARIDKVALQLTVRMGGMITLAVAVLAAIQKLL